MFFLVSGEGPTDIGVCADDNAVCTLPAFQVGPMSVIVDQVIQKRHHYSPLEAGIMRCVTKRQLTDGASELKAAKKSLGLPGKKREKETRYFFNNARVLARIAIETKEANDDDVVAVLFRDSDGTASAGRGLWNDKRRSMLNGFDEENFDRGVPMIPKPKSEAWLICAAKYDAYQNCDQLEVRSGNDNSPYSLKRELEGLLGNVDLIDDLCERLRDGRIDIDSIAMPSFTAFRDRLESVI